MRTKEADEKTRERIVYEVIGDIIEKDLPIDEDAKKDGAEDVDESSKRNVEPYIYPNP